VQYTYDDNGNQIQRQTNDTVDRSIDYTVFNKVWRVSSGQGTTKYWYDAERRRFKREDVGERFVFYIANTEVIRQNGTTTYRRQVAGAMVRFEPHNDQDVANSPRAYRITDHLGSAVAVHRVGSVNPWLHRQFAAFGATVNANAGGGALAGFAVWTDRGFTGHESVQSAGIVHMKGRIYDPELGRFLQADPFVQAPDNSQSLNRYSYVLNNPLSYTDPSGFFVKALVTDIFPAVFSIVGCASGQIYVCAGAATSASAFTSAATGQPFLQAVRDGAIAGVTAVAFVQVGTAVDAGKLSKEAAIAVHGAIGASAAAARGGDPLAGFAAAALTKSFTLGAEGFLDQINNDAIEALIAGAVGGTISEVTGGKFANGAVTAAIAYAYNQNSGEPRKEFRGDYVDPELSGVVRIKIPNQRDGLDLYLEYDTDTGISQVVDFDLNEFAVDQTVEGVRRLLSRELSAIIKDAKRFTVDIDIDDDGNFQGASFRGVGFSGRILDDGRAEVLLETDVIEFGVRTNAHENATEFFEFKGGCNDFMVWIGGSCDP